MSGGHFVCMRVCLSVCMCHSLFLCRLNGNFSCFYFVAITNEASLNIHACISLHMDMGIHFFIDLGGECLDHMADGHTI